MTKFDIRDKIRIACVFPFFGFLIAVIFFKETNIHAKEKNKKQKNLLSILKSKLLKCTTSSTSNNSNTNTSTSNNNNNNNSNTLTAGSVLTGTPNKKSGSGPIFADNLLTPNNRNNIINSNNSNRNKDISKEVLLLVFNGFLLMYAFATETVYAMLIKESFGLGEQVRVYICIYVCRCA